MRERERESPSKYYERERESLLPSIMKRRCRQKMPAEDTDNPCTVSLWTCCSALYNLQVVRVFGSIMFWVERLDLTMVQESPFAVHCPVGISR